MHSSLKKSDGAMRICFFFMHNLFFQSALQDWTRFEGVSEAQPGISIITRVDH